MKASVPPLFGLRSFEKHCAAAFRADVALHILELPGLGLDIDTEADLNTFMGVRRRTYAGEVLADASFLWRQTEMS